MKVCPPIVLATIIFSLSSLSALIAAEVPETVLIQPEVQKANDDVVRQLDDAALGGEYVTHQNPYNPLFLAESSVVGGDPIIIWARLKGLAVQLKTIEGGEQKERDWNWSSPQDWTWVQLATLPRSEAGDQILIIRGEEAKEGTGLDAVILTSDASLDPKNLSEQELLALEAK